MIVDEELRRLMVLDVGIRCFVETTFLSLYILCALFGASFLFQFCFVCLLVISLLDPCFICVGERHAPFSFEYSFASLISCLIFLATVCLLVSSRF